jgi:hypothetical protein
MSKPFVYEVRFLPGTEQEYLLQRVTSSGEHQALSYEPNDVNWMALLSRQSSFRFFGRHGSLSICLEHSRAKDPALRGDRPYWSAYRKAGSIQVKTYLGQDLTTNKLEAAAAHVAARLKEKLGLSDEDPLLTTRERHGRSKEQEQIHHLLDQLQKKELVITDLKQELRTRDQMLGQLREKLEEKDRTIAHLQQQHGPQGKRRKSHPKRS